MSSISSRHILSSSSLSGRMSLLSCCKLEEEECLPSRAWLILANTYVSSITNAFAFGQSHCAFSIFSASPGWSDHPVDQLPVLLQYHSSMGLLSVCRSICTEAALLTSLSRSRKHERGNNTHEMGRYGAGYTAPGVVAVETRGWRHDWRYLYASIFISMIGFIIRSFFRIVEYAQGYAISILQSNYSDINLDDFSSSYDGYLRSHEGYFYLLDALPLVIPLAIWVLIWPPQYIGNNPKSISRADEIANSQSRYSDQSVGDAFKKY